MREKNNGHDGRTLALGLLKSVLSDDPGVAVIHSSLPAFKAMGEGSVGHFVAAISSLVDEGWTILLPAFTYSFCQGEPFIKFKSPSETGVLADFILKYLPKAQRTSHPIYSFVVLGARVDEVTSLKPKTTFGVGSTFEWVERVNASLVMLGCGWKSCTQFHRYEELAKVKYRYPKAFSGMVDYGQGMESVEAMMWVRDLELEPKNDFLTAVRSLKLNHKISSANLWEGEIEVVKVHDLQLVCEEQLAENDFIYLSNSAEVRKNVRKKSERKSQPCLTLSVLGSKNLSLMVGALKNRLLDILPERRFEFQELPYGQLFYALKNTNSPFWKSPPNIRVFCDRLEDIPGVDLYDEEKTISIVKDYAQLVLEYHQAVGGWSIVHLFSSFYRSATSSQVIAKIDIVAKSNAILCSVLKAVDQIAWVDINIEVAGFPGAVTDSRLKYLGQFSWSKGFSVHLANCWTGLILTMLGKDARLIVVDLDNTLWGGVLGEDGMAGLKIGGDYPGNAFKDFQQALLKYADRGVALAVASKNDEDLALKAMTELPDMVIREDQLQAHAINWEPKWVNIQKLCQELNLGLGSILFVDDNPVERESVKRNLPDVKVLELPKDPAEYVSSLEECVYLRAISVNKEDLGRLKDFSVRKQRQDMREKFASMEDYFVGLGITLTLNPLSEGNVQRSAQLCQKTNQFNTTARRYDQKELFSLVEEGSEVVVLNYQDRFSAPENIGLMIVKFSKNEGVYIDLYLLSCRVLGRGIETVLPKWAALRAGTKGFNNIFGEIVISDRNTPVRDVFKQSGYEASNEHMWISSSKGIEMPEWVSIVDNIGKKHA